MNQTQIISVESSALYCDVVPTNQTAIVGCDCWQSQIDRCRANVDTSIKIADPLSKYLELYGTSVQLRTVIRVSAQQTFEWGQRLVGRDRTWGAWILLFYGDCIKISIVAWRNVESDVSLRTGNVEIYLGCSWRILVVCVLTRWGFADAHQIVVDYYFYFRFLTGCEQEVVIDQVYSVSFVGLKLNCSDVWTCARSASLKPWAIKNWQGRLCQIFLIKYGPIGAIVWISFPGHTHRFQSIHFFQRLLNIAGIDIEIKIRGILVSTWIDIRQL